MSNRVQQKTIKYHFTRITLLLLIYFRYKQPYQGVFDKKQNRLWMSIEDVPGVTKVMYSRG
jgi:hypothetical protein